MGWRVVFTFSVLAKGSDRIQYDLLPVRRGRLYHKSGRNLEFHGCNDLCDGFREFNRTLYFRPNYSQGSRRLLGSGQAERMMDSPNDLTRRLVCDVFGSWRRLNRPGWPIDRGRASVEMRSLQA